MSPEDQKTLRRKNVRLGLVLASIAVIFFVAVIVKHVLAH